MAGVYNSDTCLVKTDSLGNIQWNNTYGGSSAGFDQANSLVQTADGGYALAGVYGGYQEGWLVKTDNLGTIQWSTHYKGTNAGFPEETDCMIQTTDEGYALAGRTYSTGSNQADMWLVKMDKEPILDHFEFDTIDSPQTAGNSFSIKITAKDQYNAVLTSYTGTNTLTYALGTINPTITTIFTAGVWTGLVSVNNAGTGATISTTGGGKNGASGVFTVNAAPTPTPVPTAAPTAAPTSTRTPTATTHPTPTATPAPTPTPSIPEFSTWIAIPILSAGVLIALTSYKRKTVPKI